MEFCASYVAPMYTNTTLRTSGKIFLKVPHNVVSSEICDYEICYKNVGGEKKINIKLFVCEDHFNVYIKINLIIIKADIKFHNFIG